MSDGVGLYLYIAWARILGLRQRRMDPGPQAEQEDAYALALSVSICCGCEYAPGCLGYTIPGALEDCHSREECAWVSEMGSDELPSWSCRGGRLHMNNCFPSELQVSCPGVFS